MIKAVQALLSGIFFTFVLDFFLFLGIKLHYIDAHEIDLYYNILFADNQNGWVFLIVTLLLGILTIYFQRPKIVAAVLAALFALVLTTMFPPVGKAVGEALFLKSDQRLYAGRHVYRGDILYEGRKQIYIYDVEIEKMVKIPKKDIKQ